MLDKVSNEDLQKITGIYDKIMQHPFLTSNEKTVAMLDEFDELVEEFRRVLTNNIGYDMDTYKNVYKYNTYEHVQIKIFDRYEKKEVTVKRCAEIWTIPAIGIMYESFHDYRSYKMLLKFHWNDVEDKDKYFAAYMDYCNALLTLYKKIIDEELVETYAFPKVSYGEKKTRVYTFVRNPKYNNYWTFPEYL